MCIALLQSKRGRKDWEPGGVAAKAEVRPWREKRGEKRGRGRKCGRVWSGRRSPERAARELTAVPGAAGERPLGPAAAAAAPAPGAGPHRVPGGGGPGGNQPAAARACRPPRPVLAGAGSSPRRRFCRVLRGGDQLCPRTRGARGWKVPGAGHGLRRCVPCRLSGLKACAWPRSSLLRGSAAAYQSCWIREFLPAAELSRECEQLD